MGQKVSPHGLRVGVIQDWDLVLVSAHNLHSTMFLLIRNSVSQKRQERKKFTFHNVSINTP